MLQQNFIEYNQDTKTLYCRGAWDLANIATLRNIFNKKKLPIEDEITIDGKNITKMDSAGAWILINGIKSSSKKNSHPTFLNFSKSHDKLLSMTKSTNDSSDKIPVSEKLSWLQLLGKYGIYTKNESHEYVNFIGELFFKSLHILRNPSLWHWNTVVSIINKSGAQALPIIALLSFSIGVVISYQMGTQLQKYGADIFIVNLLGLSVLREFGPLLTAIMVGGRTGSSFTAELGIMKINQEIDALTAMGIAPVELLLLPRLAGLFIVVPLLTIWADCFGLIGGMIMAQYTLGMGWHEFILRFEEVIPLSSLTIGLCKAPIFALIIASVGCFEGMKVHGSAENIGTRTTRSVVVSIFLIIIFDGICSVLLSVNKI